MQRRTAGHQHLQTAGILEQGSNDVRRVKQPLEVVEHQEQALLTQIVAQQLGGPARASFAEADCGHDRRRNQLRILECVKRDEPRPVRERPPGSSGDLDCQARLARATRPGDGDKTMLPEEFRDLCQLPLATDEARQPHSKVARLNPLAAEGREVGWQVVGGQLEDVLGLVDVSKSMAPNVDDREILYKIRSCMMCLVGMVKD